MDHIIDIDELIVFYPENISSFIQKIWNHMPKQDMRVQELKSKVTTPMQEMEKLLCRMLMGQLLSAGFFAEGKPDAAESKNKIGLLNIYKWWFKESIAVLARNNFLQRRNESWVVVDPAMADMDALWQEWEQKKEIWLKDDNLKAQVALVEATLRNLPEILTGKRPATAVMFPGSSIELVEGIYKNNAIADYFNEILAEAVVAYIEERRKEDANALLRVLEIGAGTGGTSAMVFQKLEPYQKHIQEYCYTDISKAFLTHAENEYGRHYSYLTFKIFNIEAPVDEQGIDAGTYDLVIAANVLHATGNIRKTLRNAKAALKKNGLLLINELSRKDLFTHLTFGLLEGWWLYEDQGLRMPGCPGLNHKTWRTVLSGEGFRPTFFPIREATHLGQQIIAAESDGMIRQKHNLKPVSNQKKRKIKTEISDRKKIAVTDKKTGTGVRETIIQIVSEALKIDADFIDGDESFADYGVDSITVMHLVQLINKTLSIEINATDLFDHHSVNELAAYILSQYGEAISRKSAQNISQEDDGDGLTDVNRENRPGSSIANRFLRKNVRPLLNFERKEVHDGPSKSKEPIAIIGISGRFAKSNSVHQLWKHLSEGSDLIEEVTRWDLSKYYPENEKYCKYGSFLEKIDRFDPLFFKISGTEAAYMDPQQRIFLEESWKAIEDAGYAGIGLKGCSCGVYVGCAAGDYRQLFGDNPPAQAFWGNAGSVVPTRIAYYLDLKGPAVAIDTACSSSLVAVHLACQGLWAKETEMALAGGVFVQSTPQFYLSANRAGMLSPAGRCHTFDERADGFVPGEGAAVVVLKRLKEALAAGDHIYGVIRGSGINQDGTTNGITAPSAKSQERLERYVYETFNIHPDHIQMVEAHGTGTKLGDPIEYEALTRAFRNYTGKKEFCAIGSIKTNIGHAATTAGIAGLIKILLSLKHKKIPPSLHFQSGNTAIKFEESPFYINTHLKEWKSEPGGKRCAALSSFGFSGTNAHMVIEEAPRIERCHSEKPGYLIVLSAHTLKQLRQQAQQLVQYCERDPGADCGNMSFTLLLGRKHFNHRLACVVKSTPELILRLNSWLKNAKSSQIKVDELPESGCREQPALKAYGNQCIHACQDRRYADDYLEHLSAVAELYTQGYELDFGRLFASDEYSRVSLPSYPFSKERYWAPDTDSPVWSEATGKGQREVSVLHPLVGRNVSTLREEKFVTGLSGDEFYLSHHVLHDRMILPGVAFIEMVRAAGELAGEKPVMRLEEIVWLRPVIWKEKGQEICIVLFPGKDSGTAGFEVSSDGKDDQKLVHARGRLIYKSFKEPKVNSELVDLAGIKQRCSERINAQTCYNLFREKGLQLGPGFQTMQELYANGHEVLAMLKLPQELLTGRGDFLLHPALMDGALQSAVGLGLKAEETFELHIPFAASEVEIMGPLPRICYGHLVVPQKRQGIDGKSCDVRIMDETGKLLVKIKGLAARPFHSSLPIALSDHENKSGKKAEIHFHSIWETKEIKEKKDELAEPEDFFIVFDNQKDIFNALDQTAKKNCRDNKTGPVLVRPGTRYQHLEDRIYQIDPGSIEDYERLLKKLELQEQGQLRIIYNGSRERVPDHVNGKWQKDCDIQLTGGFYALFYLSQALIRLRRENKAKIEILYLFEAGEDGPLPQHAAVKGFIRALSFENAGFKCKSIELENGSQQQASAVSPEVKLILNELQARAGQGLDVRYKAGQRQVKAWKAVDLKTNRLTPFKEKGVYLITGGMGGLGMKVAIHLAKAVKARLVLTGRSDLGPKGQAKIEELEVLGSEVLYVKSNISRYEEVTYLVKKIKSRFQCIDGIVHAAGITRDAFLQDKTQEDVEKVLAPKIYGTIYLDLATKEEDLDFIVLFSSMASVVGSSGQCDYAYANSFMDYYALWREKLRKLQKRSGRTISINWPLWREGGMKVDQRAKQFLQNTMGVDLLETEAGLESLAKLIAGGESQVLVLTGERAKFEQILNKASGLEMAGPKDDRSKSRRGRVTGAESKYFLEISKDIVKIVSGISGIKKTRINTDRSLTEYGFDSIIFVEFANQMNKKYNLALSPAVFFEYSSIRALSQYLVYEHQEQISQYYAEISTANGTSPASINHADLKSVPDIHAGPRFQTQDFDAKRQEPAVTRETEPVAVIGISGVMPQSEDLETFWSNLTAGSDLITEVPKDRWDGGAFSDVFTHADIQDKDVYGGFIKDVDKFDALFFGISPHEAELMDPQQRIFLETVWQAMEDAGYRMSDMSGTKTGLFVGVSAVDYAEIVKQHGVKIKGHLATGLAHSVLANRISFLFNFHGPSEPVDTACSSSLIALHRAVESIRNGDCETAVAGGVNIMLSPTVFISFLEAGMLSEDGKCKTFDSSANGYVRGEGAGAVVLKPLNRAIKDKDHVYGIIKATAINHGGRAASLTAPNMIAQSELIIEAYEKAGVDPATIGYIEAHGTGTSLGDPIEVDGLKKAFTELYKRRGQPLQKGYCGIGSVKTNIGHLEAAAGIAGLLKVLLAMKSKQLPASIHFKELNPHISLDDSPFYIVSETKPWSKLHNHINQPVPRRAGLSSFGFGGANAHVVVEEYNNSTILSSAFMQEPQIIVLSAKNEDRLKKYAGKIVAFLRKAESRKKVSGKPTGQNDSHSHCYQTAQFNLMDLAYTLHLGREPMEERLAIVATSLKEVKDKLAQYCMGEEGIDGFFQGCPAENRSMARFLLEGNEGSLYMNTIIKEKHLEKLAKLWVSGIDPDWRKLYSGQSPRRLSLPTYPFARERYWVEINKSVTQVESKPVYAVTPEEGKRISFPEVLSKYEPDQRREVLESFLLEQVSRILKLDKKQKLDLTQPLVTLGFDSLLALQLKKEIATQLHLDTDAINLFGVENIADLAKLILPHIVKGEQKILNSSKIDASKHHYEQNDLIMGVL